MSNSPLVVYTKISPHRSSRGGRKIEKITIHHMAGFGTIEQCGSLFQQAQKASSNYGIGSDGRIGMYVEEKDAACTSSSYDNDSQAVTIETANISGDPDWKVSDTAMAALIDLCEDICRRNGISRLNFTGDKSGNLTMHKWFVPTVCPGPYLESKFPYIADEVNKRLGVAQDAPETPDNDNTENSAPDASGGQLYSVQVGKYSIRANAEAMLANLKKAGFDAFIATNGGKVVSTAGKENWWDEIKYLKRSEFACKCGKHCNGFPVEPAEDLVKLLDNIRAHFGKPCKVNSGIRCEKHNAAVGGASASQHLYGTAADIATISGTTPEKMASYVEALMPNSGGIGIYSWGIHVDTRSIKSRWNDKGSKTEETIVDKKSIDEIAREVIKGKWGNGSDRRQRLTEAGYDYYSVQSVVDKIMGR